MKESYLPPPGPPGRVPTRGTVVAAVEAAVAQVDCSAPAGENILVFVDGVDVIDAIVELLRKTAPAAEVGSLTRGVFGPLPPTL